MKRFFSDILKVWWNETKVAFSDFGVLIFIVVVPLAYPLLYSYVYSTEVARDVPAAIVDECNSQLSREFVRMIDASPELQVAYKCADMTEAQELMQRAEVFGVVRIPSSFSNDIYEGRQTVVGVYADLSSMIYYKNLLLPCTNVSMEMNKSIKVAKFSNLITEREQEVAKAPISYEWVEMYNPQGGYASFMLPPVFMIIIQQTLLLGMGVAVGGLREKNKGLTVPLDMPEYANPVAAVLGKIMIYAPVYLLMALYMYVAVTRWFGLPQLAHYDAYVTLMVPFVLACCAFGVLCTLLIFRREDSILLFVIMSLPLLFMSGVSWPSSNIPQFWKTLSYLFPSTFGANGYIQVTSLGVDVNGVKDYAAYLWIQTAAYSILAIVAYAIFARVSRKQKLVMASDEAKRLDDKIAD